MTRMNWDRVRKETQIMAQSLSDYSQRGYSQDKWLTQQALDACSFPVAKICDTMELLKIPPITISDAGNNLEHITTILKHANEILSNISAMPENEHSRAYCALIEDIIKNNGIVMEYSKETIQRASKKN